MVGFASYGIEGFANIKFLTTFRAVGTLKFVIRSELRFCPLVNAWVAVEVAAVVQLDGIKLFFKADVTHEGR